MTTFCQSTCLCHHLLLLDALLPFGNLVVRQRPAPDHALDDILYLRCRDELRAHWQICDRRALVLLQPVLDGATLIHLAILRQHRVEREAICNRAQQFFARLIDGRSVALGDGGRVLFDGTLGDGWHLPFTQTSKEIRKRRYTNARCCVA